MPAIVNIYADVVNYSDVEAPFDVRGEDYAPMLAALLPHGKTWKFEEDSDFYSLLRALSYRLYKVKRRGEDLLREFDPATVVELIDDWERVLGLPGDDPTPATTLADRRLAMHAKLLGHGDPSIPVFEALAAGLGYDVTVVRRPYEPFVAGSPVGDALLNNTSGGWSFVWLVIAETGSFDARLRWLIESLQPAHGQALFDFHAFIVDEPFDDWTADDPDGWTVANESAGDREISEVGPGETYGGTGSGAANLYAIGDGTEIILSQALVGALSVGERYGIVFDVTRYLQGTLVVADSAHLQFYEEITTFGQHYIEFEAANVDVTLAFLSGGVPTNVTIDNVRLCGPLSLT